MESAYNHWNIPLELSFSFCSDSHKHILVHDYFPVPIYVDCGCHYWYLTGILKACCNCLVFCCATYSNFHNSGQNVFCSHAEVQQLSHIAVNYLGILNDTFWKESVLITCVLYSVTVCEETIFAVDGGLNWYMYRVLILITSIYYAMLLLHHVYGWWASRLCYKVNNKQGMAIDDY